MGFAPIELIFFFDWFKVPVNLEYPIRPRVLGTPTITIDEKDLQFQWLSHGTRKLWHFLNASTLCILESRRDVTLSSFYIRNSNLEYIFIEKSYIFLGRLISSVHYFEIWAMYLCKSSTKFLLAPFRILLNYFTSCIVVFLYALPYICHIIWWYFSNFQSYHKVMSRSVGKLLFLKNLKYSKKLRKAFSTCF